MRKIKEWLWQKSLDTVRGPVLHVINADTRGVRGNGQRVKIRLAQIDAPEVAHPRPRYGKPGQP